MTASDSLLAHEEGDGSDNHHAEQRNHQEVGQFFAEAEVRGQCGQTQTGGEAGDRAHPRALRLGLAGGRSCSLLLARRLADVVGRRRCRALHAGRTAATEALGFGVIDVHREADDHGGGHGEEFVHACLLQTKLCAHCTQMSRTGKTNVLLALTSKNRKVFNRRTEWRYRGRRREVEMHVGGGQPLPAIDRLAA
jgi:hypothetical protein